MLRFASSLLLSLTFPKTNLVVADRGELVRNGVGSIEAILEVTEVERDSRDGRGSLLMAVTFALKVSPPGIH